MLQYFRENYDRLSMTCGAAVVAFFAISIDQRVADMQEFDSDWAAKDREETAAIIALVEEVRTAQGIIMGRLDGTGAELIYQVGVRDGQNLGCRP